MVEPAADRWAAGHAYEAYMGRWSRALARVFVDWLRPSPERHWLEIGCGTGALTSAISELCQPASLTACDPSESFLELARNRLGNAASFHVMPSMNALPTREAGFDVVVSGLVLNFVPEPSRALEALCDRAAPGATLAAYVWDYAGGVAFLQHFWREATALDPAAGPLDESRRFAFWQPHALTSLFAARRLLDVQTGTLEIETEFANFDDYWSPFLGGVGPAPSYVAFLGPAEREALRARLAACLPSDEQGRIRLRARAFAVRAVKSR